MPTEAPVFPFAGLLAELRARELGVGLHEYNDLALLVSRWKGTDPLALRDAIAALIARDRAEVQTIRELFDEWLAREEQEQTPATPPEPRLWKTWHVAAIVLLAAMAIAAATWWYFDPPPPPVDPVPDTVATDTSTSAEPGKPEPPVVPEAREQTPERPMILAAILLVMAVIASSVPQVRRRQRQWAQRYGKQLLASKEGPHHYEQRVIPSEPSLPPRDVEEVATLLGRAREIDGALGDALDVEESLRLTLREGLRPHLIFEPPPRNVPVLLLIDLAWQMRPWRSKVDSFADNLARQGVVLDRWFFDGDPLLVSRTPHDRLVRLEELAATRSASSLMIIGSGQALPVESLDLLGRLLRKWTFRTWLHPVGNPAYWRRELAELPIRMWPMTGKGVRAAAVEISRKQDSGESPLSVSAPRSVTREDVERMKQLIAFVPHASLELAEELRRRFAPEVPEEVMLFLGAEGVFYGETIRFPPEQLQRLLATAAQDPARERAVRAYLLEVLRESKPVEGSVALLRWQLDEALHRVQLGDATAAETLRELAAGPLRSEVGAALDLVQDADAKPLVARAAKEASRNVPSSLPARSPDGTRAPLWGWPRWWQALGAGALAVAVALLLGRWAGMGEGDVIPNVTGAYKLGITESGVLVTERSSDAPVDAAIYRGGTMWRPISLAAADQLLAIAVASAEANAWFQVRSRLPGGSYALSEAVWVPAVAPPEESWVDDAISFRLARLGFNDPNDVVGGNTRLQRWQTISRISKEFGVALPSEAKTLREIAALLRQALPNGPAVVILSLGPANTGDTYGLISEAMMLRGQTDEPLLAPAGSYRIEVGGETAGTLDLAPNQLARQTITLPEKTTGTLLITSLPRSVSHEDLVLRLGQTRTPVTGKETILPRGAYSLVLETDFYSWTSKVLIEPGQVARVSVGAKPNRGIVVLQEPPVRVPAALTLKQKSREWVLRGRAGTYDVTFKDRETEQVTIVAGEQQVFKRLGGKRRTLYLRDPDNPKAFVEIWTTDGDGVWRAGTETYKVVRQESVRTVDRKPVLPESGVIVSRDGFREFFIPDSSFNLRVLTRQGFADPWKVYRVSNMALPTAN
ncbi:MAG: hypothetical protein M3P06_19425 [Acidobacteriota bacterium]|nr:hypothetical protein [Acidobacteriota bacterium]